MNIVVNDKTYEADNFIVGVDEIYFQTKGETEALTEELKEATSILTDDAEYTDLTFKSVLNYDPDEGIVTVTFKMADRVAALEASQAEQDATIAEILFGGEA